MGCREDGGQALQGHQTITSSVPLHSVEMTAEQRQRHGQRRQKQKRHHHHQHWKEEKEEEEEEQQPLLPSLPDHLAQLCLARLPARLLFSVCRPWRRLLYSTSFPPFLSLYALLSSPASSSVELQAFDPIAGCWLPLPPPPSPYPQLGHLLLRHPSFLSRSLPVQSVAAAGHLVLVAATTHALRPPLPSPLAFHPASSTWRLGPPLPAPRRWCAAGVSGGRVYVASGVGLEYSAEVARSVERWDLSAGAEVGWERMAPLRDGRFSREAVEAVASGGKLYMVNVKGKAAKEGAVYDVAGDRWEEMPPGMLSGWTGPAAARDDEEPATIYVVDEAEGELRSYDRGQDAWAAMARSELLKGAVQVATGGGRVCVACRGGETVVVVDVGARPARMWAVKPPAGRRVVALHVLPRMSLTSSNNISQY